MTAIAGGLSFPNAKEYTSISLYIAESYGGIVWETFLE